MQVLVIKVDTGAAVYIECDPRNISVSGFKSLLFRRTDVPEADQILICRGRSAEDNQKLSTYVISVQGAGDSVEEHVEEVYLFDRRFFLAAAFPTADLPLPPDRIEVPETGLRYGSSRALNTASPDDARRFVALADAHAVAGKKRAEVSRQLVHEQQNQYRGFLAAVANLDLHYRSLVDKFTDLRTALNSKANRAAALRPTLHTHLEHLRGVELHRGLQHGDRRTLFDLVNGDRYRDLARFFDANQEKLRCAVDEALGAMERGVYRDLCTLADPEQHQPYTARLEELQLDVDDTLANLNAQLDLLRREWRGGSSTASPRAQWGVGMSASQVAQLEQHVNVVVDLAERLHDLYSRAIQNKRDLVERLWSQLSRIAQLQITIHTQQTQMPGFRLMLDEISSAHDQLSLLPNLADAYAAVIGEMSRRQAFRTWITQLAAQVAEDMAGLTAEETTKRDMFQRQYWALPAALRNLVYHDATPQVDLHVSADSPSPLALVTHLDSPRLPSPRHLPDPDHFVLAAVLRLLAKSHDPSAVLKALVKDDARLRTAFEALSLSSTPQQSTSASLDADQTHRRLLELERLQHDLDDANARIVDLTAASQQAQQRHEETCADLQRRLDAMDALQRDLDKATSETEHLNADLDESHAAQEELRQQLAHANTELSRCNAELVRLQALLNDSHHNCVNLELKQQKEAAEHARSLEREADLKGRLLEAGVRADKHATRSEQESMRADEATRRVAELWAQLEQAQQDVQLAKHEAAGAKDDALAAQRDMLAAKEKLASAEREGAASREEAARAAGAAKESHAIYVSLHAEFTRHRNAMVQVAKILDIEVSGCGEGDASAALESAAFEDAVRERVDLYYRELKDAIDAKNDVHAHLLELERCRHEEVARERAAAEEARGAAAEIRAMGCRQEKECNQLRETLRIAKDERDKGRAALNEKSAALQGLQGRVGELEAVARKRDEARLEDENRTHHAVRDAQRRCGEAEQALAQALRDKAAAEERVRAVQADAKQRERDASERFQQQLAFERDDAARKLAAALDAAHRERETLFEALRDREKEVAVVRLATDRQVAELLQQVGQLAEKEDEMQQNWSSDRESLEAEIVSLQQLYKRIAEHIAINDVALDSVVLCVRVGGLDQNVWQVVLDQSSRLRYIFDDSTLPELRRTRENVLLARIVEICDDPPSPASGGDEDSTDRRVAVQVIPYLT